MEKELLDTALKYGGFTPLEILFLLGIIAMFSLLVKQSLWARKDAKENTVVITNLTNVIENNTKAIEKLPEMITDKIKAHL